MRGDLANRCHTIRRRLRVILDFGIRIADFEKSICIPHSAIINRLAEGTGLEPASDKCAVVFGTTALPVRLPFQRRISDCELRISDLCFVLDGFALSSLHFAQRWLGRPDLNRESRVWNPMVCRLAYAPKNSWCMW